MRPIDADFAKERIRKSDLTNREKIALMLVLEDIPTLAPPPNDPLTMEELRKMDGEPMWVVIAGMGRYAVIQHCGEWSTKFTDGMEPPNDRYGTYWLAYRRRPEVETV